MDVERVHVVRVSKRGGAVVNAAGGDGAGRVGDIHHLYAVVTIGGHYGIGALPPLKVGHVARAAQI